MQVLIYLLILFIDWSAAANWNEFQLIFHEKLKIASKYLVVCEFRADYRKVIVIWNEQKATKARVTLNREYDFL